LIAPGHDAADKEAKGEMGVVTEHKLEARKRIALVAHDNTKQDLLEWARWNKAMLEQQVIYATGTTGRMLHEELGLDVILVLAKNLIRLQFDGDRTPTTISSPYSTAYCEEFSTACRSFSPSKPISFLAT
jgi:hypothetical protein